MKEIIKRKAVLIAAMALMLVSFSPLAVFAQSAEDVCQGVGTAAGTSGCTPPAGSTSVSGAITLFINTFSVIIGITGVVFIMIGGFKYITSGGDSNSINSAKQTITYALVGLAVAVMSQVIARFVLSGVS